MTERERVIDRIQKLLAHATSAEALGSAEEAAAFAAKANALLLEHKLSLTEVELAAELAADPVRAEWWDPVKHAGLKRGKNRRAWLELLVASIAEAHLCEVLVIPGSKAVVLVGAGSDLVIARYLLVTLVQTAERLAILHERRVRLAAIRAGAPMPVKPKVAFLMGFTVEVRRRLNEMRAAMTRGVTGSALLRLDQGRLAVQRYIEQNDLSDGDTAGKIKTKVEDRASYDAGREAGSKASLHGGLTTTTTDQRAIGSAPRALPPGRSS